MTRSVMFMDVTQPWARQPKEPTQWYDRFQRFLFLGVTRSIYQTYIAERREKAKSAAAKKKVKGDYSDRVGMPKSWSEAARKWQWKERATAFDDAERKKRDEFYAAQSDVILRSGFASRFARIAELNLLAEMLQIEVRTEDKRWLPDAKWIGGEFGERVDMVRFNSAVVEQYRKTLEDIAVEMGERVRGVKVEGNVGVVQFAADELAKAKAAAENAEKELLDAM